MVPVCSVLSGVRGPLNWDGQSRDQGGFFEAGALSFRIVHIVEAEDRYYKGEESGVYDGSGISFFHKDASIVTGARLSQGMNRFTPKYIGLSFHSPSTWCRRWCAVLSMDGRSGWEAVEV